MIAISIYRAQHPAAVNWELEARAALGGEGYSILKVGSNEELDFIQVDQILAVRAEGAR